MDFGSSVFGPLLAVFGFLSVPVDFSIECPLLADEIQRLPPGAALEQAMLDYAWLRDQSRACQFGKETLGSRAD